MTSKAIASLRHFHFMNIIILTVSQKISWENGLRYDLFCLIIDGHDCWTSLQSVIIFNKWNASNGQWYSQFWGIVAAIHFSGYLFRNQIIHCYQNYLNVEKLHCIKWIFGRQKCPVAGLTFLEAAVVDHSIFAVFCVSKLHTRRVPKINNMERNYKQKMVKIGISTVQSTLNAPPKRISMPEM